MEQVIVLYFLGDIFEETLIILFVLDFSVEFFLLGKHVQHEFILVRQGEKHFDVIWLVAESIDEKFLIVIGLDIIVHGLDVGHLLLLGVVLRLGHVWWVVVLLGLVLVLVLVGVHRRVCLEFKANLLIVNGTYLRYLRKGKK